MFDGCAGKRCVVGKEKGAVSGWKEVYVEGSMCAWALCGNDDFGNLRNLVRTLIDDCSIVAPALSFAAIELFSLWSRVRVYNSKDCGTKKLKPSRVNFIVTLFFPCRSFAFVAMVSACVHVCVIWWSDGQDSRLIVCWVDLVWRLLGTRWLVRSRKRKPH